MEELYRKWFIFLFFIYFCGCCLCVHMNVTNSSSKLTWRMTCNEALRDYVAPYTQIHAYHWTVHVHLMPLFIGSLLLFVFVFQLSLRAWLTLRLQLQVGAQIQCPLMSVKTIVTINHDLSLLFQIPAGYHLLWTFIFLWIKQWQYYLLPPASSMVWLLASEITPWPTEWSFKHQVKCEQWTEVTFFL